MSFSVGLLRSVRHGDSGGSLGQTHKASSVAADKFDSFTSTAYTDNSIRINIARATAVGRRIYTNNVAVPCCSVCTSVRCVGCCDWRTGVTRRCQLARARRRRRPTDFALRVGAYFVPSRIFVVKASTLASSSSS